MYPAGVRKVFYLRKEQFIMYYIFDAILKIAIEAGASKTGQGVLEAIRDFFPRLY